MCLSVSEIEKWLLVSRTRQQKEMKSMYSGEDVGGQNETAQKKRLKNKQKAAEILVRVAAEEAGNCHGGCARRSLF